MHNNVNELSAGVSHCSTHIVATRTELLSWAFTGSIPDVGIYSSDGCVVLTHCKLR